MDLLSVLNSKCTKAIEKRTQVVEAINKDIIDIGEIYKLTPGLNDKKLATIMEALEEVTRNNPQKATLDWLAFAEGYIDSASTSVKREASRIVGNIAHLFENNLQTAIEKLLFNTNDDGTVVRWGSAYALAKIIVLPRHANSSLSDTLTQVCEKETESGVKSQYLKALNKAQKLRI